MVRCLSRIPTIPVSKLAKLILTLALSLGSCRQLTVPTELAMESKHSSQVPTVIRTTSLLDEAEIILKDIRLVPEGNRLAVRVRTAIENSQLPVVWDARKDGAFAFEFKMQTHQDERGCRENWSGEYDALVTLSTEGRATIRVGGTVVDEVAVITRGGTFEFSIPLEKLGGDDGFVNYNMEIYLVRNRPCDFRWTRIFQIVGNNDPKFACHADQVPLFRNLRVEV